VVLRDGARSSEAEILDWLRPRIASWWRPDGLELVDAIPKTSVGKIATTVLRDTYTQRH
jgi:fatty-acyl-CoA synthase